MKEYKAMLHCSSSNLTMTKKVSAENQDAARLIALEWVKTVNLLQPYYLTVEEIDWTGSCVTK